MTYKEEVINCSTLLDAGEENGLPRERAEEEALPYLCIYTDGLKNNGSIWFKGK